MRNIQLRMGAHHPRRRLLPDGAALYALLAATASPVLAAPQRKNLPVVYTVDASAFSAAQKFTAICLEGLANRTGPRVYLNYGASLRWMQIDSGPANNPSANSQWITSAPRSL